jgi:hypothetical protein
MEIFYNSVKGKRIFCISTKRFKYYIEGFKIERHPLNGCLIDTDSALFQDILSKVESSVFYLNRFWEGWRPLLRAYDLRKIFKHIESLNKEINDAHIYLDELGAARTYDLKYLSIQERIDDILKKYKEKFFYY